jgi:RES domain-containing protein
MFLWRISNHSSLNGRGGLYSAARWQSLGRPVVYFAESPSGALTEALVHLELTEASFPDHYKLLKAEAPDNTSLRQVAEADLPRNWRANEIVTRTIGDEWLASANTALLRVPSAIVPETFNSLLNPVHPEAKRIRVLWHREYPWDRRLFEKT